MPNLTTNLTLAQSGIAPDSVTVSTGTVNFTVESPGVSNGGETMTGATDYLLSPSNAKDQYIFIKNVGAATDTAIKLYKGSGGGTHIGSLLPGDFVLWKWISGADLYARNATGAGNAKIEWTFFTSTTTV